MKLLWHSNAPWANTGYGQQTALFCPRIQALGHDVAISAFYGLEGATLEWRGMRVFPTDRTRFGKEMLPAYAMRHAEPGDVQDCQVVTLMDVWALTNDAFRDLRMASWTPVDHDPLPPRVFEFFARTAARPIAMSRFGQAKLQEADLDAMYVPHGVDTNLFAPRSESERRDIREKMNLPADAFVVGMVANNKGSAPSRKAFPQVFQAFAELRRRHDDAFLYLHSDVYGLIGEGLNLLALAEVCGIPPDALCAANQVNLELGIPARDVAYLHAAFDVLANPSYGEGFGIPIIEAQACGTPVIVTDWTAMTELCGAGWMVGGEPWYDAAHGSFYLCPSARDVTDAMLDAYENAAGKREQAREFAVAYDADRVMDEHWKPVLDTLERPREVPALPNRAMRRAAAKQKATA